jgi:hypothetical protein
MNTTNIKRQIDESKPDILATPAQTPPSQRSDLERRKKFN